MTESDRIVRAANEIGLGLGASEPIEIEGMDMSVAALRATDREYSPETFQMCVDLIEGGDSFAANADKYIIKAPTVGGMRTTSNVSGQLDLENPFPAGSWSGGMSHNDAKKKWFKFISLANGIFNQIASSANDDPVRIFDSSNQAYWLELETRLRDLTRRAVKGMLEFGRAFLALSTKGGRYSNLQQAREDRGLDVEVNLIDARDILAMEWVDEDTLAWVKTRKVECVRSTPFGPEDTCRETYQIITDAYVMTYVVEYPEDKPIDPKMVVSPTIVPHDFGVCPVFASQVIGSWAAKELAPSIIDWANCKANLRYWVAQQAHPLLIAPNVNNLPRYIANTPDSCVIGDLRFEAPPSDAYDSLRQEEEKAREDFLACLNSMANNALSLTQNPRQSAAAKQLDIDISGQTALISSYASALRKAIVALVLTIQKFRKEEDVRIEVAGLQDVNGRGLAEKINALQTVANIPGYPKSALKWQTREVALELNPSMPHAVRQAMLDEMENEPEEDEDSDDNLIPDGTSPERNEDTTNENRELVKTDKHPEQIYDKLV